MCSRSKSRGYFCVRSFSDLGSRSCQTYSTEISREILPDFPSYYKREKKFLDPEFFFFRIRRISLKSLENDREIETKKGVEISRERTAFFLHYLLRILRSFLFSKGRKESSNPEFSDSIIRQAPPRSLEREIVAAIFFPRISPESDIFPLKNERKFNRRIQKS